MRRICNCRILNDSPLSKPIQCQAQPNPGRLIRRPFSQNLCQTRIGAIPRYRLPASDPSYSGEFFTRYQARSCERSVGQNTVHVYLDDACCAGIHVWPGVSSESAHVRHILLSTGVWRVSFPLSGLPGCICELSHVRIWVGVGSCRSMYTVHPTVSHRFTVTTVVCKL